MPLPPPDQPAAGRSASNPARIMLGSPLAATVRARVYRQRRQRTRERGLRAVAAIGTLVVHLLFLFGLALGSAEPYRVAPPESKASFLQVRLIEPPEPPPPPPVRGTPPKERGPRHQGHASRAMPDSQRRATTQAAVAAAPTAAAATPVLAHATESRASTAKPVAAPPPPVSLPQPAPTPDLQPIPLAAEPPTVSLTAPALQPPVPPKFQPESVRRPQVEGNRPVLPPPSLAMPALPTQAAPPITLPSIALNTDVPKSTAPASVTPARAEIPAAPPVPELQPIPLPAQPSPSVNLQTSLSMPMPTVPREKPRVQAPVITVAEPELAAVPSVSTPPASVQTQAPAAKVAVADMAPTSAIHPSIERPRVSAPDLAEAATPTPTIASQPAGSSAPAATAQPVASEAESNADKSRAARDVSTAPDATPQGSDDATLGEPDGIVAAPPASTANTAAASSPRQGSDKGDRGNQPASGQPGGNQPGAEQGEKQGELGSYVQLTPHGDTQIMSHAVPNIGYQPTRFDQDWTPEGESSIDTALRHAVEKTAVSHTFHLPRGVRIECTVLPLLPMALFGCGNPDPPPEPVDEKVYQRLHLAPANPLLPPAPVASTTAPATMLPVDNSVQCAEARVAGSPLPPGCEAPSVPPKPFRAPASSSSSWVPASDQFH